MFHISSFQMTSSSVRIRNWSSAVQRNGFGDSCAAACPSPPAGIRKKERLFSEEEDGRVSAQRAVQEQQREAEQTHTAAAVHHRWAETRFVLFACAKSQKTQLVCGETHLSGYLVKLPASDLAEVRENNELFVVSLLNSVSIIIKKWNSAGTIKKNTLWPC